MSISRVIASALLVVTMSFPWSGSASLDAASAAGSLGAFTGFVVDDSGAKLRGMTVTVTGTSSPDDVLTSAITDGDGYFVVGPDRVLLESKTTNRGRVDGILAAWGIRPLSMSKYAIGTALLRPELAANRWNRLLRREFGWQRAVLRGTR